MKKYKGLSVRTKLLMEIIAALVCIAVIFSASVYAGYIYMPDRESYGALWNMFKCEDKNSIDVLITGSSLAYCDVIPSVIYENTGYTSYVLAGPEMTFPISYYYLKEALEYQTPSVIMLEATGVFFKKYQDFSKVNIGYLPYDLNRIEATFNAAEKEERLGLLFPLYNYHDQWASTRPSAYFSVRPDEKTDILAGYTHLIDSEPQERMPREIEFRQDDFDYNCKYMHKIKKLCDEKGIELILFFVPSAQYPSEELMQKFYLSAGDIRVIDYNEQEMFDSVGIDMQADYYDFLHFNIKGARKFSAVFAERLANEINAVPKPRDEQLWNERVEFERSLPDAYPDA